MEIKYNIGYVDEKESQVKTYRRILKEYGFNVIGYKFKKGLTLEELMAQIYKSDIDLLMIDYKLRETNWVAFNGEEVEREIYENKPQFPHIIFTNKVEQAEPHIEDWKIIFDKDVVFEDDENTKKFIRILVKSIEQYRNLITKKKKAISHLLEKGKKKGLNAAEKSILLETQEELWKMDKTKKREIPKQLISLHELENLSKTRKEAEEFLRTIILTFR